MESEQRKTWRADVEKFALSLPEAWSDEPWGDSVVKVRKKIFVFLGTVDGDPATGAISVKLTDSLDHGRSIPGAAPVGYGLGKHGWTYVPFAGLGETEGDVLFDFVEESYRAVAPKTLVKQLDARSDTA
ncbi:MAG TPA: MmcQ/YjbR family DNA-binding protein [Ilumatobacter sp.]|nr:MmcQ/YjbR family DNA-binding protein [Ilumatobacter sp.]